MFTTPFSELLQVLRRLRMPQIVLELMLIMYRFLFLLSDAAHGLLLARRLRGGRRGYKAMLRETAAMAGALFGNTMHRYYGLSQGLLARGFTRRDYSPALYCASCTAAVYRSGLCRYCATAAG
ncbi:CbiQ family ECF transporter T component [Paenibacillus rhizoplanae]